MALGIFAVALDLKREVCLVYQSTLAWYGQVWSRCFCDESPKIHGRRNKFRGCPCTISWWGNVAGLPRNLAVKRSCGAVVKLFFFFFQRLLLCKEFRSTCKYKSEWGKEKLGKGNQEKNVRHAAWSELVNLHSALHNGQLSFWVDGMLAVGPTSANAKDCTTQQSKRKPTTKPRHCNRVLATVLFRQLSRQALQKPLCHRAGCSCCGEYQRSEGPTVDVYNPFFIFQSLTPLMEFKEAGWRFGLVRWSICMEYFHVKVGIFSPRPKTCCSDVCTGVLWSIGRYRGG